ncbi:MAG: helix-turn-helix transcriptional regulator [Anaerolineaceae bacterium]|nr:helix-turn-helix transcriptional regulator [Anaerolineaceae bacterium]
MTLKEQDVFGAVADPTRRQLLETLSIEGDKTATELAKRFPITRQGVAKHLRILEDAGLVSTQHEGRETIYTFHPEPLAETVSWVESINAAWDERLQALRDYLLAESDNEA